MLKNEESKDMAVDLLLGVLSGTALTMLLLYLFAVLIAGGRIPERLGETMVMIAAMLGAVLSGGVISERRGRGAVPMGLAGGLLFFPLLLICGAISGGGFELSATTAKLALSSAIGGVLGGLLGTSRKKSRRAK